MSKLDVEVNNSTRWVSFADLVIGRVYWSEQFESYVLRVYNCIVDLQHPEYTYDIDNDTGRFCGVKSAKLIIER